MDCELFCKFKSKNELFNLIHFSMWDSNEVDNNNYTNLK